MKAFLLRIWRLIATRDPLRGPLTRAQHHITDITSWVNSLTADEMALANAWSAHHYTRYVDDKTLTVVHSGYNPDQSRRIRQLASYVGVLEHWRQMHDHPLLFSTRSPAAQPAADHYFNDMIFLERSILTAITGRFTRGPLARYSQLEAPLQELVSLVQFTRQNPGLLEMATTMAVDFTGTATDLATAYQAIASPR